MAKASSPQFSQKTFINVPLTDEHKAQIKAWTMDLAEFDSLMTKLIEEGIRVTIVYDDFNQCFSTTLAQKDDKHRNAPYLLSGKGSTPLKSVRQALFIHWKLLDGDWATYSQSKIRPEIDD
jgi:hypothetical protein